jgi:hypothetical protein
MLLTHLFRFSSFWYMLLVLLLLSSCFCNPGSEAATLLKGNGSVLTETSAKKIQTFPNNAVSTSSSAEHRNLFVPYNDHRQQQPHDNDSSRHLKKQSKPTAPPLDPIPPFTGVCSVFPISVVCAYGNVAVSLLSFWNSLGFGNLFGGDK